LPQNHTLFYIHNLQCLTEASSENRTSLTRVGHYIDKYSFNLLIKWPNLAFELGLQMDCASKVIPALSCQCMSFSFWEIWKSKPYPLFKHLIQCYTERLLFLSVFTLLVVFIFVLDPQKTFVCFFLLSFFIYFFLGYFSFFLFTFFLFGLLFFLFGLHFLSFFLSFFLLFFCSFVHSFVHWHFNLFLLVSVL
jgi:hypothetical protein